MQHFAAQNASELASGNNAAIGVKLSALSPILSLNCLTAKKLGDIFFSLGNCQKVMFAETFSLDRTRQGGIRIDFEMTLPAYLLWVSMSLQLVQTFLLLILTRALSHLEKQKREIAVDAEKSAHAAKVAELEAQMATDQAIARTTQMLAHDVRKPFALLQSTLDTLERANSLEEFQKIRNIAKTDVQRSLISVNGLLTDIMEIGAQLPPTMEETDPTHLINFSLVELFRIFPNANIDIEYNLKHSTTALCDSTKLSRVFSNILGNALQAMKHQGTLRITTRNVTHGANSFIEFTIGNSGPHIPQEYLAKIFDAFFTKNKKGGTGLGLAIAHRVINLHGGEIECRSAPGCGVDFIFTLPATNTIAPMAHIIHSSAAEFIAAQRTLNPNIIFFPTC